jgi:hypothetical protein
LAILALAAADDTPKPKDKPEPTSKQEKDTYESLLKQMLKNRQALGELLAKVTDEKLAKEQKPNVEKLGKEMQDILDRLGKATKPNAEEEKKIRASFEGDYTASFQRIHSQVLRLQESDYGKDLVKLLRTPASKPPAPDTKTTAKSPAK